MRKPPRRATSAEIVQVHQLLKEILFHSGEKDVKGRDIVRYPEGKSDATVARLVADDFPDNVVVRIRTEMFGQLHAGVRASPRVKLDQGTQIEWLTLAINALVARVAYLEKELGVNPNA